MPNKEFIVTIQATAEIEGRWLIAAESEAAARNREVLRIEPTAIPGGDHADDC